MNTMILQDKCVDVSIGLQEPHRVDHVNNVS